MLRNRLFRRAGAVGSGVSLLMSATSPGLYAKTARGTGSFQGTVVETFTADGKVNQRFTGAELAGSLRLPAVSRTPSREEDDMIAKTRAQLRQYAARARSGPHAVDLSLSVLDALAAPSRAERHRILASLPIEIVHTSTAEGYVTTAYVRGKATIRITTSGPTSGTSNNDRDSSADEAASEPSGEAEHSSSYTGSSRAAQPVAPKFCDEDPESEDACASEQDRDDALAAAAAAQADLDAASSDNSAAEADCFSQHLCWYETGTEMALDAAHAAPADMTSFSSEEVNTFAYVGGAEYSNCAGAYLDAGIGIAWGVSGIAVLVAVAGSPDPVSKLALFGAWTNMLAGVGAAVLQVNRAIACT